MFLTHQINNKIDTLKDKVYFVSFNFISRLELKSIFRNNDVWFCVHRSYIENEVGYHTIVPRYILFHHASLKRVQYTSYGSLDGCVVEQLLPPATGCVEKKKRCNKTRQRTKSREVSNSEFLK